MASSRYVDTELRLSFGLGPKSGSGQCVRQKSETRGRKEASGQVDGSANVATHRRTVHTPKEQSRSGDAYGAMTDAAARLPLSGRLRIGLGIPASFASSFASPLSSSAPLALRCVSKTTSYARPA